MYSYLNASHLTSYTIPPNSITCRLNSSNANHATILASNPIVRMSKPLVSSTSLNTPFAFGSRQTRIDNSTTTIQCLSSTATGSCQILSRTAAQTQSVLVTYSKVEGLGTRNTPWSHVFIWVVIIEMLCLLK
jgi:hypothetical protein